MGPLEKDLTRAGGEGGQGNGVADLLTFLMLDANMHAESLYFNFFGQLRVYSILYSMDFLRSLKNVFFSFKENTLSRV